MFRFPQSFVLWRCSIEENLSTVKCQYWVSDRAGKHLLIPSVRESLDVCGSDPKVVSDRPLEVFVIEVDIHFMPLGSVLRTKVQA